MNERTRIEARSGLAVASPAGFDGLPSKDQPVRVVGSQPEFASALDNGLKMATSDMVSWLVKDFGMEPWAAHLLIGYQARFDVVTVAGSMAVCIAKNRLPKKV
jgi:acetamidase/formamidase